MLGRIFSHSLLYAFAPQIPRVVSIFLLPLFTKYLDPIDYGINATITAYTGILSGIKDLGITILLVNAFYHFKDKWKFHWRVLYGYMLMWAPVLFALAFSLIWIITPPEAEKNRLLVCLLSTLPLLFFEHTIIVGFRYFHLVKRNPVYISIVSVITGLLTIAINYYVIVILKQGYMGWLWATFLGSFVSFLFYLFPVVFRLKLIPIFYLNSSFFLKKMRVSLPMIPHTYSAYLLNASDRMVMNVLKIDIGRIGVYNLASTFGSYFEILGNALGLGIGPFINDLIDKKTEESENQLKNLIYFFQFLFIFGAFLASLWMKEIFGLLISNEELRAGYRMAVIIIMGYAYRPMYWGCVNRLIYYGRTAKLWKISFVAGVLNLLINFTFIPIFGYKVAIFATFISLLYIGFSGYFLKEFKSLSKVNYHPVRWILFLITMSVAVYLLKDIAMYYKIIITLIVAGIGLKMFLKLKKNI